MSPVNPPVSHETPSQTHAADEARERYQRHLDAGIRVASGVGARPFRPVRRAPKLLALFRRLFA